MCRLRIVLPAVMLCLLNGLVAGLADEKGKRPPYIGVTGAYLWATSDGESRGYCNGCVVFDDNRPLACFGVNQRAKQKGRYLYLILFRTGPDRIRSVGVRGKFPGTADHTDEAFEITLGKKVVKVAYKFDTDEKTGAVANETVKVGDSELKKDGPRVFLVDLTKDRLTYRAVRVDLPADVPDLGSEKKTWPAVLVRAVKQLREKSPEVKKFLEGRAKE